MVNGRPANLYGRGGVSEVLPPLANVLISDVLGRAVPLYVGQARMTGYWPLSIVEHGVGLNITPTSYAGRVYLGFTVARCAAPTYGCRLRLHAGLCRTQAAALMPAKAKQGRQPPAKPAAKLGNSSSVKG